MHTEILAGAAQTHPTASFIIGCVVIVLVVAVLVALFKND